MSKVFTSDNLHDFLNETNFGNGLVELLIHEIPYSGNHPDAPENVDFSYGKYDINKYINYANQRLVNPTSKQELVRLLLHHHPLFNSSDNVDQFRYDFDEGTGLISENDPAIQRIVEIFNAYASEFNSMHNLSEEDDYYKNLITVEEAASHAVLQDVPIYLDSLESFLNDSKESFSLHNILNLTIRMYNPDENFTTDPFESSLITHKIFRHLISIFISANALRSINNEKLIHYELLQKYFDGTDPNYPEGASIDKYCGGQSLNIVDNPNISAFDKIQAEYIQYHRRGQDYPILRDEENSGIKEDAIISLFDLFIFYHEYETESTRQIKVDMSEKVKVIEKYLGKLVGIYAAYKNLIREYQS